MSARLLNLLLLAALLGGSAAAWPHLPPRIPAHFDFSGTPDRWVETTWLSWFMLPLIAIGLNALLYGAAALSTRDPRRINMPGKDRLLALPAERQQPVMATIREGLEALAAPVTLSFCLIQLAVYRTATGQGGRIEVIAALVLIVLATPIILIGMLLRSQSELDRQVRLEHGAAGS
ncbi:MAG TPA: DUF1648 domain-containing protein [Longimicrobiales bacterium]